MLVLLENIGPYTRQMAPLILNAISLKDAVKYLKRGRFEGISSDQFRGKIDLPAPKIVNRKDSISTDRTSMIFKDQKGFVFVREYDYAKSGKPCYCRNSGCMKPITDLENVLGVPTKLLELASGRFKVVMRSYYCSFECVAGYLYYSNQHSFYVNLKFVWDYSYPDKELLAVVPQEFVSSEEQEEMNDILERSRLVDVPELSIFRELRVCRVDQEV